MPGTVRTVKSGRQGESVHGAVFKEVYGSGGWWAADGLQRTGGGHCCWFGLAGKSTKQQQQQQQSTDVLAKAEERTLSALWPTGAYNNKDQMAISRDKSIVGFRCSWCGRGLRVSLQRPRPETVYVPQIRVETSDSERIITMYQTLVSVLKEVEAYGSGGTLPRITKEGYPELCKAKDKYFVAPINILQAIGFERVDGVYTIPHPTDRTAKYARDMRVVLEAEAATLKETGGDVDRAGAWLPWMPGALTSRISWYADNVSLHVSALWEQCRAASSREVLLPLRKEAGKAWSWAAAYWYFEHYSIIRSEHRELANQLLSAATRTVCAAAQKLWRSGEPLVAGEGYVEWWGCDASLYPHDPPPDAMAQNPVRFPSEASGLLFGRTVPVAGFAEGLARRRGGGPALLVPPQPELPLDGEGGGDTPSSEDATLTAAFCMALFATSPVRRAFSAAVDRAAGRDADREAALRFEDLFHFSVSGTQKYLFSGYLSHALQDEACAASPLGAFGALLHSAVPPEATAGFTVTVSDAKQPGLLVKERDWEAGGGDVEGGIFCSLLHGSRRCVCAPLPTGLWVEVRTGGFQTSGFSVGQTLNLTPLTQRSYQGEYLEAEGHAARLREEVKALEALVAAEAAACLLPREAADALRGPVLQGARDALQHRVLEADACRARVADVRSSAVRALRSGTATHVLTSLVFPSPSSSSSVAILSNNDGGDDKNVMVYTPSPPLLRDGASDCCLPQESYLSFSELLDVLKEAEGAGSFHLFYSEAGEGSAAPVALPPHLSGRIKAADELLNRRNCRVAER